MMPRPISPINLRVAGLTGSIAEKNLVTEISWSGLGGQLWAIVGANGAGKSTFLSLLAGTPAADLTREGSIELDGTALALLPARERAQRVAYLPQHPETPSTLTVRETVQLGRAPYRSTFAGPSREDDDAVEHALATMDLAALAERRPETLSGGERQRMHFARIIAQGARVWLLDEPYGHLDFAHQAKLLDVLAQLIAERDLLVVIVAHDLFFLPRVATHMALMREGTLIAQGKTKTVWTPALAERAFGVAFSATDRLLAPSWRTATA